MKKDHTPDLFFPSAIALIVLFICWLGADGPIFDKEKWNDNGFAGAILGGLIGGIFTAATGFLAFHGIKRQINEQRLPARLDALDRERERIERRLPGLRQALRLCGRIRVAANYRTFRQFEHRVYGILTDDDDLESAERFLSMVSDLDYEAAVDKLAPLADHESKTRICRYLGDIAFAPDPDPDPDFRDSRFCSKEEMEMSDEEYAHKVGEQIKEIISGASVIHEHFKNLVASDESRLAYIRVRIDETVRSIDI